MSSARTDIHALVAGVSLYVPGRTVGQTYPPLRGCAADAREVASYLMDDLGVPQEQRLLTCSGAGPEPDEPEECRPTYANLVAALKDLAAKARLRDQVLVYFAGHGTHVPTLIPEVKGAGERDECLVPSDAGTGARLLRDVEIAALVAQMANRGLDVTLLLDCCYAGGALRALDLAVRGVSGTDVTSRPPDSAVTSRERLATVWEAARGRCPAGAVLLAACRPGEQALEPLLHGRRRGLFTWALLDALRRLGTGIAYRRLHERVLARVHARFEIQTPVLEGATERRVLGGEPRRPLPAVPVLQVNAESVVLAAGAPQGVAAGAWFAVYPLGAQNLSRDEDRVALVEVTEAGAAYSRARLTEMLRPGVVVDEGASAVLVSVDGVRARRSVGLLDGIAAPLLSDVATRLAGAGGSGFLELAPSPATADFLLAADDGDTIEILDAAGKSLMALSGSSEPSAVISGLEHLARFRNVQELDNPAPASDLAGTLRVSLGRLARAWRGEKPPRDICAFTALPPSVWSGDWVCLTIENRSVRELNVAVLDLQADWSIRQAYPGWASFCALRSGAAEHIPFEVRWDFRQPRGRDLLKIFAVTGPTDFRWLELPALGEPPLPPPEVRGLRAGSSLEALFAALTGFPPRTRVLAPERQPQHAWTVVDLTLEVTAHGR
jgi:hypothetical protein